jgi:thiamine-phosphate pyrophosphorylase
MQTRQPRSLPRLFLMTDERMGDGLWDALARLPKGAGVVFRHYGLPAAERRAMFARVRTIARARRLTLVLAGPPRLAIAWRADGAQGRSPHLRTVRPLIRSAPVHDRRELLAARNCALRFVSPVYATRSHPGGKALGVVRLGLLIGRDHTGVVALGGMTPRRARALRTLDITRWAAIDWWSD